MRADKSEEVTGLDITEHGERGYNQAIMSGSPFEDTLSAPLNTSTINDIGMNNHNL
jgi:Amt family ammonium transporter